MMRMNIDDENCENESEKGQKGQHSIDTNTTDTKDSPTTLMLKFKLPISDITISIHKQ